MDRTLKGGMTRSQVQQQRGACLLSLLCSNGVIIALLALADVLARMSSCVNSLPLA